MNLQVEDALSSWDPLETKIGKIHFCFNYSLIMNLIMKIFKFL